MMQGLRFVAAVLPRVSCAVCTHHPPSASALASLSVPAWSCVKSWLLRMQPDCVFTPSLMPASNDVLHIRAQSESSLQAWLRICPSTHIQQLMNQQMLQAF